MVRAYRSEVYSRRSFLFCLNLFGESLGLHVSINPVTSGISGLLGIPGVAALIVIEKFII